MKTERIAELRDNLRELVPRKGWMLLCGGGGLGPDDQRDILEILDDYAGLVKVKGDTAHADNEGATPSPGLSDAEWKLRVAAGRG